MRPAGVDKLASSAGALPRRRLLIVGPLPPPYAGPELGTESLLRCGILREHFDICNVNTTVRSSNRDKGRLDAMMAIAYLRYVFRLVRALLVFRPHVIMYLPTSATRMGWVRDGTTLLLGSLRGGRVVLQFRGGHFRHFFESLGRTGRGLVRWLLGRSAAVLVQASVLRAQFAGLVPEQRIGVLHNGISAEFFARFENVARDPAPSCVTILFVGHLSQAKGYCDLLKTIPVLASRFAVRFRFIGVRQGVERNVFFNQATGEPIQPEDPEACYETCVRRQGFEQQVEFLGDRVYGEEKYRAFETADIFVLPSYSEGFSRAILEAMAAGLPSVVTAVGAVPDILEDGVHAFIVRPGDVEALAERLQRLIADGALRLAMGRASREQCRRRFLQEALSRELVTILDRLEPC